MPSRVKLSVETIQNIRRALAEDIRYGDITSELLIPKKVKGSAKIISKEEGIFFGKAVIQEVFDFLDPKMKLKFFVKDGSTIRRGRKVLEMTGSVHSILRAERTLLNYIGHLSGVASTTRSYVKAVSGTRTKILDTRKTTPNMRELEKLAVLAGGGANHRFGLFDFILVKENHRRFGDLKNLKLRKDPFELEVRNIKEFQEALGLGASVIMLDHFSIKQLERVVGIKKKKKSKAFLEASGNINLKTVRQVARTGVDAISVGAITHSAKSHDFSLLIA